MYLAQTLELALAIVREPVWPTALRQLRELVEREGRIRRQGDQVQLRDLVTTLIEELSRAQGGSEQAFAQVLARPRLWAPTATWLERGLRALGAVRVAGGCASRIGSTTVDLAHAQDYPFYIEVFCIDDTYQGRPHLVC